MIKNFKDHYYIKKYLEGDMAAFNLLVDNYKKPLFGYIYNMTNSQELSDDIFQETFFKVIKNIQNYKEYGNFKSWIFSIATNLVKDHWKKKSSQDDSIENYDDITNESGNVDFITQIESDEDIEWLRNEVDKLPEKLKTVLLLHVYSELSFKEISIQLNCSINTVLGRMHYAKNTLKQSWDTYHENR